MRKQSKKWGLLLLAAAAVCGCLTACKSSGTSAHEDVYKRQEEIHTAIRLSAALRSTSEQAEKLKEELQTAAPTGHDAPTGALQQSPDELYKLQKTSRALKAAGLFLLAAGMIAGGLAAVGWLTQRFLAGGLLPVLGALCAAFMLAGAVLLGVGMEREMCIRDR